MRSQRSPHRATRSSCRCRSSQRRESGQIAQRAGRRKKMPTASARAQNEAEGVHGDGAKSRTRHEKQIRCLAEWIPLGKRRADSGPRRALIARRPRELHEADPGHGPRRRGKPQGRRAFGRCGRRGGPLEGCPPNSRAVDQDLHVFPPGMAKTGQIGKWLWRIRPCVYLIPPFPSPLPASGAGAQEGRSEAG